ncbi:C1 family peptidase [Deinococcus sp. SM5_A1]|uniref:C1 family peptidase n=1 Tax=Deinococcus sp. SM5_A1 TaxID=3379094 RepID=UPI00385B23EC
MKRLRLVPLIALTFWLAACGGSGPSPDPKPTGDLFKVANAWTGEIPADAETVSPDAFSASVAAGDLVLMSSAALEAQKAAREMQYQQDKTFLQGVPDPSPDLKALLTEAAASPTFEGDRPVKAPDGQTVVLFGLGTQLHNAAEEYRRSESVENALSSYTLTYDLLPDALKVQAPTPASLGAKSLAEIQVALNALNTLLSSAPSTLGTARLEPNGDTLAPQALNAGNGTDNNGVCAAKNYVKSYWFPLKNFISPVKNQASRGTCWAFTAIGAVESRERVQNNNAADLSEQFLVNKVKQDWDSSDYVDGYHSEKALETALSKGQALPSEGVWTYNGSTSRPSNGKDGDSDAYAYSCNAYTGTCSDTAHQSRRVCTTVIFKFCGYATVKYSGSGAAAGNTTQVWKNGDSFKLNNLRLLLAQGHVLMASFPVYRGFSEAPRGNEASPGVVSNYDATTMKDGKYVNGSSGSHAVQIVGFLSNDDLTTPGSTPNIGGGGYFIIKNSWGCGTGDGGYYYFPADYVSRHFNSLSTLNFDTRRSDAWKREQATPGGSQAPGIVIKTNPAVADLRVEKDLAALFSVSHPVAKSVTLTVTSSRDGTLYNGPWTTATSGVLFGTALKHTFASTGTRTLTLLAQYGATQAQATLSVNVVNTPPSIVLDPLGDPSQGVNFSITARINDINESNASALCANTTWSVDAPDTLASPTGCTQTIKFGTTGNRGVTIRTRDSEGATDAVLLTLTVQPPPANPYPTIISSGVYTRDLHSTGGVVTGCYDTPVASGATIDLRQNGCSFSGATPPRFSGGVEVNNPSGETLTYEWKLYVTYLDPNTNSYKDKLLRAASASSSTTYSSNTFGLYNVYNAGLGTDTCRVTLQINAPDPSRSKSLTVWTGRCTYYSYQLN